MNNKIFSFLIAMAMTVAGVSLTSCGDDDNNTPTTKKATTASAQPEVCINAAMFDYFDITCTIDGETVTLTKDNTYDTSYTPYLTSIVRQVRMYKVSAKQYTKFPATMTVSLHSKVKAGVDLRNMEDLSYLLYVDIAPGNNNGDAFKPYVRSTGNFQPYTKLNLKKMSDDKAQKIVNAITDATVTKTGTFENAGSYVAK